MTQQALRHHYLRDAVQTVTPARLVTMLYDALVRDLGMAEDALAAGNNTVANERLLHAQEIVLELRSSLDVSVWEGGPGLAQLYQWLLSELIGANVQKNASRVAGCRRIAEPLADAWHQAAQMVAQGSA